MNKYTEFTQLKSEKGFSKENIKFLCSILENKHLKDPEDRAIQLNNIDAAKIFIELLEDMNVALTQDDIILLNKKLTILYAFVGNTIYVIKTNGLIVEQYKLSEFNFTLSYNTYSRYDHVYIYNPATIKTIELRTATNTQITLSQEDCFDPYLFNDSVKQIIKKMHS